ncbi:MAG: HlyD family efflux transporter periplasmic adaptor subunit [Chthoniobacter sp.]|uniref:HlyD family secretion protein n=1 Tax=Chthoniobacter sp. TaxID=2510640 RepID=UPI0032A3B35B
MKAAVSILRLGALMLCLVAFAGCDRHARDRVQGYVEGEFVYVASPFAGQLETLSVQRGAWVKAAEPLFALECGLETAAREEAERKLNQGRANLEDAKKGKRPAELESAEAQLKQARAASILSEQEFKRQDDLHRRGVTSGEDYDRARSARDQDNHRVQQLEADLETAHLGSRVDQVAAAEANVRALEAALAQAEWNLAQKRQSAPQNGLVFDTLYQQGEWVAAGHPIVALLPPENIKVRAFVPEEKVGTLRPGGTASVFVDGVKEPFVGKVTFISPQAEYTPPVIYSQESRKKLVFMIELRFDAASAAKLHPGQPVDVEFH